VDSFRLLLFPIIGVTTAVLYRRSPRSILRATRAGMLASGALIMGLLTTGLLGSGVHTLSGHAFVVMIWLLTPAAFGVSVGESFRSPRWLPLLHAICPLLLLVMGALAAITGYLPHGIAASEPERLRFVILHQIGLPTVAVIVLLSWLWLSGTYARGAHNTTLQPSRRAQW
jgi:uncharacterized membrane protein